MRHEIEWIKSHLWEAGQDEGAFLFQEVCDPDPVTQVVHNTKPRIESELGLFQSSRVTYAEEIICSMGTSLFRQTTVVICLLRQRALLSR